VVRAQARRLAAELRALDEAGWQAPSACEGWTVKDVASHMAESADRFQQIIRARLQGAPAPEFTPALRAERQAAVKARSGGEIADQIEHGAAGTFDLLEGASPEGLAGTVRMPFGEVALGQLAPQRLQESTLHSWDIARARDPHAALDADAVPLLLDLVLASAGRLAAKGASEAREGTYRLELTGPGGGPVALSVRDGEVRAERGAPAAADATIHLPSEACVRLLWGRLDLADAVQRGAVRVEGDREKALRLSRVFRGV
jgi:uncharacterized protein (TIGR03083 family)